jgi:hypothetical protein
MDTCLHVALKYFTWQNYRMITAFLQRPLLLEVEGHFMREARLSTNSVYNVELLMSEKIADRCRDFFGVGF